MSKSVNGSELYINWSKKYIYTKSQNVIFHPLTQKSPSTVTKFGIWDHPADQTNWDKFFANRFNGYNSVRGQNSNNPIDLKVSSLTQYNLTATK